MTVRTRAIATRLLLAGLLGAAALQIAWMQPEQAVEAARPTVAAVQTPTPTARPAAPAEPEPPVDQGLLVKRVLDIPGPIKFGDYHWDEQGVPAGEIVVTVDLTAETLSVFRDGYEIGATAVLFGANDKPTPLGVFPITQKRKDHVSNLYDAPMPYMMRLTNDGVAIHGSDVKFGYATHGCIGVPTPFAKLLFEQAKIGTRVIITDGKMLQMGGLIAPA